MAASRKSTKAATKDAETAAKTVTAAGTVKEAAKTLTAAEPVKTAEKAVTAVVEAAKAAKKEAASKAAEKKTSEKKPTVRKTVKKAEQKTSVHVQFSGKSYSQEDLIKMAKDVWKYDLKQKVRELTSIELYVKPEENVVYYVMNQDFSGSFGI